MHNLNNELILGRMRNIANVQHNKDLGEILGVPTSTISNWKTNKSDMSLKSIVVFAEKFDVDLNWLIYGKEKNTELSTHEKMALMAFNALDDGRKLEIIGLMLNGGDQQMNKHAINVSGNNGNYVGGDVKIG